MIDLAKYPKFARDSRLMKRLAFLETEWRRAYPSVNLESQAGWAHAWLVTSGKKYTEMSRFLNSWFRRCEADLQASGRQEGPIKMPPRNDALKKQKEYESQFREDMTPAEMAEIKRRNFPQYKTDAVKFPDSVTTTLIENENKSGS